MKEVPTQLILYRYIRTSHKYEVSLYIFSVGIRNIFEFVFKTRVCKSIVKNN